ncbi:uncharacterized protein CIMG_01075 [Coccidioides immitis RS]|uniref:Uncharacterized protein n=1 Tax=Coccidioides immitis (strain RS) TaxID=246410 RepID=J3KID5_COCIM|nr:uncharacterized protein CIMG_01075 [Coccidioides immitis RS]EAS35721.3 hypothetical protein CIMG_01075 [Coccidioides immitis RS]
MAGRAVWSYAAGGYDPQEVRANYYAFWLGAEAQSGTTREKTIESLKRRGIGEEAAFIGANDLANSIINYASGKLKEDVIRPPLSNAIPSTAQYRSSKAEEEEEEEDDDDDDTVMHIAMISSWTKKRTLSGASANPDNPRVLSRYDESGHKAPCLVLSMDNPLYEIASRLEGG